jgi:hypothetical protein
MKLLHFRAVTYPSSHLSFLSLFSLCVQIQSPPVEFGVLKHIAVGDQLYWWNWVFPSCTRVCRANNYNELASKPMCICYGYLFQNSVCCVHANLTY